MNPKKERSGLKYKTMREKREYDKSSMILVLLLWVGISFIQNWNWMKKTLFL
jgi:hypothetical protein